MTSQTEIGAERALAEEFAGMLESATAKMRAAEKHAVGSTRDAERRTTLREFGDEVYDCAPRILAVLRSHSALAKVQETLEPALRGIVSSYGTVGEKVGLVYERDAMKHARAALSAIDTARKTDQGRAR